jgi:hypothetical protein
MTLKSNVVENLVKNLNQNNMMGSKSKFINDALRHTHTPKINYAIKHFNILIHDVNVENDIKPINENHKSKTDFIKTLEDQSRVILINKSKSKDLINDKFHNLLTLQPNKFELISPISCRNTDTSYLKSKNKRNKQVNRDLLYKSFKKLNSTRSTMSNENANSLYKSESNKMLKCKESNSEQYNNISPDMDIINYEEEKPAIQPDLYYLEIKKLHYFLDRGKYTISYDKSVAASFSNYRKESVGFGKRSSEYICFSSPSDSECCSLGDNNKCVIF